MSDEESEALKLKKKGHIVAKYFAYLIPFMPVYFTK